MNQQTEGEQLLVRYLYNHVRVLSEKNQITLVTQTAILLACFINPVN